VSIVNYHGHQVYDSYVLPQIPVTDYRTPISGIRPHHLKPGYARPFKEVQKDVSIFLEGRVLVGHAIGGDLKMLMLSHPKRDIRDTSRHPPFRERAMGKTPSLRKLAKELLGLDIQTGEHSSIEDARVVMLLYRKERASFDAEHSKQFGQIAVAAAPQANGKAKERRKKKKKKSK
jgi:RNA exonuclease 4